MLKCHYDVLAREKVRIRIRVEVFPFLATQNSKEALREQAAALFMRLHCSQGN